MRTIENVEEDDVLVEANQDEVIVDEPSSTQIQVWSPPLYQLWCPPLRDTHECQCLVRCKGTSESEIHACWVMSLQNEFFASLFEKRQELIERQELIDAQGELDMCNRKKQWIRAILDKCCFDNRRLDLINGEYNWRVSTHDEVYCVANSDEGYSSSSCSDDSFTSGYYSSSSSSSDDDSSSVGDDFSDVGDLSDVGYSSDDECEWSLLDASSDSDNGVIVVEEWF